MLRLIFATSVAIIASSSSMACTTIIVGKAASADGSIIVARNADAPNAEDWRADFVYHAPRKDGYVLKSVLENQFSYQMPPDLMGYSGLPEPRTRDASFDEAGFNDVGVGVSATETIISNEKTLMVDPYNKATGVVEEVIPSIVLPQMKSAREGVEILGRLIETYGSGEGFGVAFVDKDEAWYLENAGGHEWVAERIPDDAYFVSANQSRLGEVHLDDTGNFLSSPNLIRFAEINGLFDPNSNEQFSFRKSFGRDKVRDAEYNYPRVSYLQGTYTNALQNQKMQKNDFPSFAKPDKKLSITDVQKGLSAYFVNTASDPYTTNNPGATVRPISVYRTYESNILQTRRNLPPPIANVEYIDFGITALGMYVPFYQGANIPKSYEHAPQKIDDTSAFWKFHKVELLAMQNFSRYEPIVRSAYDVLAKDIMEKQKRFEETYQAMYRDDPNSAQYLLDQFTEQTVNDALAVADRLQQRIMEDMSSEIDRKYRYHGA